MTSTVEETLSGEVPRHVEAFERDGYVHLKDVYRADQVAEFHRMRDHSVRDWQYATGRGENPDAVDDVLERFPRQGLDAVANPLLLGLAEAVMGPVVQLDSAVLASDPSLDPSRRDEPVVWHRDRFGFFPLAVYTRPQSIVCLAYLQEMTADVGPLRVVPASHREPVAVGLDRRHERLPDELRVHTMPGDVVAVHHNLLHSGTRNVSGNERRFLGFIYNMSSLIHRDNFDGPNCQALIATARRMNDRRTLRLLGADPLVVPRQNSGFVQPATAYWPTWRDEDDCHAAEAAEIAAAVNQAREVLR